MELINTAHRPWKRPWPWQRPWLWQPGLALEVVLALQTALDCEMDSGPASIPGLGGPRVVGLDFRDLLEASYRTVE